MIFNEAFKEGRWSVSASQPHWVRRMSVALKLYTGESQLPARQQNPPQFWTIREAFEQRVLPKLKRQHRSQATIDKWGLAVGYWELVYPDNPPISQITDSDLTAFSDLLLAKVAKITTHTTANQKMMHVQSILKACRDALDHIPVGTPLPDQAATRHRRIVSDELLDQWYRQCSFATLSRDRALPAPLIWRALLALFLSMGCRRGEACMMQRTAWHRDAEFPDFPQHPDLDVDGTSPYGWLVFHTPKTRAKKHGLPLVLPVSAMLARHLDQLDRLSPGRERMFPIGDHATSWQGQLSRIQWGVKRASPEDSNRDHYSFQDLRKTVSRRYRKSSGREVAKYMLGHQPRGVNATFYDDLTEDAVTAVNTMHWPKAFVDEASTAIPRQLTLF